MPPPPEPVLPIRLLKALDVLFGRDEAAAFAWMSSPNEELRYIPMEKTRKSVEGLAEVVAHLEALISRRDAGGGG